MPVELGLWPAAVEELELELAVALGRTPVTLSVDRAAAVELSFKEEERGRFSLPVGNCAAAAAVPGAVDVFWGADEFATVKDSGYDGVFWCVEEFTWSLSITEVAILPKYTLNMPGQRSGFHGMRNVISRQAGRSSQPPTTGP